MHVYISELGLDPLEIRDAGEEAQGWCEPWTAPAIQASTRAHLASVGALSGDLESADVVLVDLVDHLAQGSRKALRDLRRQTQAIGAQLVVRLHSAWRGDAIDDLDGEGPDLDCVWDTADAVLVASRHHLVRLASFGGIDAARTRFAPVAFDGLGGTATRQSESCGRTQLLVAGETHRKAMEPVLEMLAASDPKKATYQVIYGLQQFQEKIVGARVLLVPAVASFGDRSLVDAALSAGAVVVLSPFAGAVDGPLPGGVEVVADMHTSAGWRAALERALTLEPAARVPLLRDACERQVEILRSIWVEGSNCAARPAA